MANKITVFTPSYNRAQKLGRAYRSLLNQTCFDFEWLIIDDGSKDGTDAIVREFITNAPFSIRYFWKENGGRHTAVNYSYQFIQTPYVVTLDSDDELAPDAIEKMIKTWEIIPQEDYDRFWCISGREAFKETGEMIGKPYPNGINLLTGMAQRKEILKYRGEKHCCRKTSVLIEYPFPVYEDTKFVTENMVWDKINRKYDQYCVNDIYGYYFTDSEDGITNKGTHKKARRRTFYYSSLFYINEVFDELFFNSEVIYSIVNVSRCALLSRTSYIEVMKSIDKWYKKILVTISYPISIMWIVMHRNVWGELYEEDSKS